MDLRYEKVRDDLRFALGWFPLASLEHVRDHRQQLVRNRYVDPMTGVGCLFYMLSCPLPAEQRIQSKESLTRFFTGGDGDGFKDLEVYQPAKWLVRLIDGETVARYGGLNFISWEFILEEVEKAIAERQARQDQDWKSPAPHQVASANPLPPVAVTV